MTLLIAGKVNIGLPPKKCFSLFTSLVARIEVLLLLKLDDTYVEIVDQWSRKRVEVLLIVPYGQKISESKDWLVNSFLVLKRRESMALPKFDQRIQETVQSIVPELIRKPLNKELNALNTLETQSNKLVKGDINLWEMMNLMKDMGEHLPKNDKMVNAQLQIPDPAQGGQQLNDDEMASVQNEQPYVQEKTSSEQTPSITEQVPPESTTLVVHASGEKDSEERFTDSLFQTTSSEYSPTPPRDENKGKGIATEEEPVKHFMPLIEQ
ncbi:hypothetical protein Tco_0478723 [Tanacetum coccineum]